MIPKVIHYIWLGRGPKPIIIQKCISSWYTRLEGYRIQCWNEENLDLTHPYLVDCIEKKLYAFAADFIRFKVLSCYGGIYLDTDIEVIGTFDKLLNLTSFIGYEDERIRTPAAGVIGASPNAEFLGHMVSYYSSLGGVLPVTVCSAIQSVISRTKIVDLTILPQRYFYPYNPYGSSPYVRHLPLMAADIQNDTIAIHHWNKSWKL